MEAEAEAEAEVEAEVEVEVKVQALDYDGLFVLEPREANDNFFIVH